MSAVHAIRHRLRNFGMRNLSTITTVICAYSVTVSQRGVLDRLTCSSSLDNNDAFPWRGCLCLCFFFCAADLSNPFASAIYVAEIYKNMREKEVSAVQLPGLSFLAFG